MKIGINNYPLNSAHKNRGIGYYTENLIKNLKKDNSLEILEFQKLSELPKVDLIHYPWFDFYFHSLPIRKPYPTVVTIHDVIPLIYPDHYPAGLRGKINFFLQKISLNNCEFIITDSEVSKRDIINYLKIKADKIVSIPLAISSNFGLLSDTQLLRVKRKYKLPDEFLLYVGDVNWVKNIPFLIEGFRQLLEDSVFRNLYLILVGGVFLKRVENIDHPELESLKKVNRLIQQSNLENFILRPGNLGEEDLVAFQNLATIYVQPSYYEGFGLPVLQSLACGTPVVASHVGSLPEVAGNAAIYFDPNDFKQFISILKDILVNKSLQDKLIKLGFKQAAKFSWEKTSMQTSNIYKQVIRSHIKSE